ncbi:MAG TPA: lipopolysaccharide heptosyltransferase I [Burkholderiales bacterium]|nr:lipopolysaccharide heptosyltransferase I [Burkholderiales bacterium]
MARVLLIKTSSLGDVIHNLPVIHDIRLSLPACSIDWVVEETYVSILAAHPGIDSVVPVAVRRWRRTPWRKCTRDEVRSFISRLRSETYDAVIDTQGLLKSALIGCAAHGPRYGLDWRSAREPLAWLYERTFRVPWDRHAVERNRSLVAQALGYPVPDTLDYGIRAVKPQFAWLPAAPYVVLLHATSAASKLWPEERWISLGNCCAAHAQHVILPWGGEKERARSERLARSIRGSIVPPALTLGDVTQVLAGSRCVAGLDTGLTHLAAALGVPTVGIFVRTDPVATGLYARTPAINVGGKGAMPSVEDVDAALQRVLA